MNFELSFANIEITHWSRMLILKQMLDKLVLRSNRTVYGFPLQNSNRAYDIEVILKSFITSV